MKPGPWTTMAAAFGAMALVESMLWKIETIPTHKLYYHAATSALLVLMFLCFTLAKSLEK